METTRGVDSLVKISGYSDFLTLGGQKYFTAKYTSDGLICECYGIFYEDDIGIRQLIDQLRWGHVVSATVEKAYMDHIKDLQVDSFMVNAHYDDAVTWKLTLKNKTMRKAEEIKAKNKESKESEEQIKRSILG